MTTAPARFSVKAEFVLLSTYRFAIAAFGVLALYVAIPGQVEWTTILRSWIVVLLGASVAVGAYEGRAAALIQQAFSRVATDALKTHVQAYLDIYEALLVNLPRSSGLIGPW